MKDNIDNSLYEVFHDREYPSDKVRENIRSKIAEMEADKKSSHKVKINYARKIVTAGVALIFMLSIMIATNVGGVRASIQKLFAIVPGVGVVEVDESNNIYYMKGDSQTKGNDNYEVKLNYIYASKDSVRITWEYVLKNYSYTPLTSDKKIKDSIFPEVKIMVGDKTYKYGSSMSGSTNTYTTWLDVKGVTWNSTDVYQIVFQDLSFDFSLQNYETYKQTEDIGPTQMLNDISITAIPEWVENSVSIALYNLNVSNFDSIFSYKNRSSECTPYLTVGDATIKHYKTEENKGEAKMVFDLSGIELTEEMKTTAVLHIPSIQVRKKENQKINISIAKDGSYHASKESVQFADSTMHIINVEKATKVGPYDDFKDCLKLTLKFDYNMKNLELENMSNLVLSGGEKVNRAWSCKYDENTGYYSLYIQDYAETTKIKSITFLELIYCINDEYQINLGK